MTTHDDITRLIGDALSGFNSDFPVSPTFLARQALQSCDPDDESPEIIRFAAELQFRQIARGILRQEYEMNDDSQKELFEKLQPRYPGAGENDGFYVPLLHMSADDFEHNILRLQSEADAKQAHADALQAKYNELQSAGHFQMSA